MKSKLILILFYSILAIAEKPSVLEQQVAISLEHLPDSLLYCTRTISFSVSQEVISLASSLRERLKNGEIRTLRLPLKDKAYTYSTTEKTWKTEVTVPEKPILDYPSHLLDRDRRFPRNLISLIAQSSRHLIPLILQTLRISANAGTVEDLGMCLESSLINNAEIISGGLGETNIQLVTLGLTPAMWPSFPRIVLTDGYNMWDLTSQLTSINRPLAPTNEKILGVLGLAIARTQLTQHLLPIQRSFILPLVQWSLRTENANPSVFLPDEYIQIRFDRFWDAVKKESRIDEDSLQVLHKRLITSDTDPTTTALSQDKQLEYFRNKVLFFGL